MNKKGFTFLEFVVVIGIIGILAKIALNKVHVANNDAHKLYTVAVRHLHKINHQHLAGQYLALPASPICMENEYYAGSFWLTFERSDTDNLPYITKYQKDDDERCHDKVPPLTENDTTSVSVKTSAGCKVLLESLGNVEGAVIGAVESDKHDKEWLAFTYPASNPTHCVYYNTSSTHLFTYDLDVGTTSRVTTLGRTEIELPIAP